MKLKSRGINFPKLAIGDGAVVFWAALEEVYPEIHHQRCWMHKTMNVISCQLLAKIGSGKGQTVIA